MTKLLSPAEAHDLILRALKEPNPDPQSSFDLYLPDLLARTNPERDPRFLTFEHPYVRENVPVCAEVAWLFCCRALLRPEPKIFSGQNPSDSFGYTLTALGRAWLEEADDTEYIPTEPVEIARLLGAYKDRFGSAFQERAQEAIRCWTAHAYLASCVMCGAAAESVLLTIALAKRPEAEVLKMYHASGGRRKVENLTLGSAPEHIRLPIQPGLDLLKYWRDDAGHGAFAGIAESEAHTSIVLLLRLASAVNDRWNDLTSSTAS